MFYLWFRLKQRSQEIRKWVGGQGVIYHNRVTISVEDLRLEQQSEHIRD